MDAVRLTSSGADFDIVRETRLRLSVLFMAQSRGDLLTLIAAYKALAISLSCSSLGLLPRISGSQNWPTALFMWPILPCGGGGALTHWDGSRPTPHTM